MGAQIMSLLLRILHLEDNANDAELLRVMLERQGINCAIKRVETREAFQMALEREQFDLIISDFTLPSFDGLSALTIARQKRPEVPFVFVSGTIGEEAAVESLRHGAIDYVLKDRLSRLAASVERAVQDAQARVERRTVERKRIEAELLRTQRMQSIGALAGGIAHDLNNVLAPILMVADLIRDELASEDSRKMLDTAKASAQRGAEMVKQILSFARGVSGELKVRSEERRVGKECRSRWSTDH